MLEEDFALLCELDAAGIPQKKAGVQAFLQFADGLADGRLADVKLLGGTGNVAAAGHLIENPVLG